MKKSFAHLSAILFLILISFASVAQKTRSADRLARKNTITTIYPEAAFDSTEVNFALEKGASSIKGILFTKEKTRLGIKPLFGRKIFGSNISVTLFPVTSYFEAWHELRKQKQNKNTVVKMSDMAYSKKIMVTTDDYGRFLFENLKPGKYFIQAFMNTDFDYYKTVNVGASANVSGGTTYYTENQYYTLYQNERMEKYVEIKVDGKMVEVKLK
jgi:hypothetical protein